MAQNGQYNTIDGNFFQFVGDFWAIKPSPFFQIGKKAHMFNIKHTHKETGKFLQQKWPKNAKHRHSGAYYGHIFILFGHFSSWNLLTIFPGFYLMII